MSCLAGFTDFDVFVVDIGYLADRCLAVKSDKTNFAGRKAYLAGLGRVLDKGASASSPLTGFLRD